MPNPPLEASRGDKRVDGLLQIALAAAVVLLATSLVRFTVTRFGYQPTLTRLHAAQLAEANADRAMLDMETGVRGYQLSADQRFLEPYMNGLAAYPSAVAAARVQLSELPAALAEWNVADADARLWQRDAAAAAVASVIAGQAAAERPDLSALVAGKTAFDRYRHTADGAANTLAAAADSRLSAENVFRTATGTLQAMALVLLAFALLRRQRRPHVPRTRSEGLPISGAGWQDSFTPETMPADPDALAASITRAAQEISGATAAHLWLAQEDGELRRVNPGQPTITAQRRRHDVALRAHREGAIITSSTRARRIVAVPLLHEGRTLGVVELTLPGSSGEPTNAQTEMLRAWGRQAARSVVVGGTASHDRLTGLAGRPALDVDLVHAVERAYTQDKPLSLVVLEVDQLTRHSVAGTGLRDDLVRTVGAVLTDTVRTTDTAYRTGEGTFAILLPGAPATAAASLAERLRQILARRFVERGVTASFGVATCPDAAGDEQGLLEAAESALYDAQRFGGNRAQPAHPLSDELALVRRRVTEIG